MEVFSPFLPYLILISLLFVTYSYVLFRGGAVSDDIQGIEAYDGTLYYPDDKDPSKKVLKICYGTLSKWVRYHLCGGNFPSRHHRKLPDGKLGDPIPSGKVMTHHHLLNVVCAAIASSLLYHFLVTVTNPTVALLTVCLFIVHPTCTQAVAWPSAIGYILSLICITASLNISHWTYGHLNLTGITLGLAGMAFFQIWGVYAQAIPMFTWTILLVLGQYQMAAVAFLFSGIAAAVNLREYVVFRKSEFKKQNMAESTSINIRKPIVALKTLAYYLYLSVFPNRLGLYHVFGFHYTKKIELWDWRALTGFTFIIGSVFAFIYGPMEVKLGLVWFTAFLFLFLNWITAQQWVTERYLYIPVIGLCLIVSYFLQDHLNIYFLILGLLMSRTLVHLPTYENELNFYLSNTWNFPKSEVAFGNLGVTYTSVGLAGAANDMWLIACTLNPDYDVPHYNIFASRKSQAMLMIQNGAYEQGLQSLIQSIPMIEKVLTCKVLHFQEMWKKERDELVQIAANPVNFLLSELGRLYNLKQNLQAELLKSTDVKRAEDVKVSISNNETQITNLLNYLNSKGIKIDFNAEKALMSKLIKGA